MQDFARFLLLVAFLTVAASLDAAAGASRPDRTFVTTVTSFDPNADIGVFALVVAPNGTLHAGGPFRGFDLAAQQGFASFNVARR